MHRFAFLLTASLLTLAPALLARPAAHPKDALSARQNAPAAHPKDTLSARQNAPAAHAKAASSPTGQLISGSAGVKYSFRLPAGLRLTTPARDSANNFAEYAASLEASAANGKRPFRFEVRITKFDKRVDCPAFAEFLSGLDGAYTGEQYDNHSPSAIRKIAAANFVVRVFHKDVTADFNQKSASYNVHHLATVQGDSVLSLIFFTDARDEAGGLALQNEILNSLSFGAATGSGVCLAASHKAASSAAAKP